MDLFFGDYMLPRIVLFDLIGTLTKIPDKRSAENRMKLQAELIEQGLNLAPEELEAAYSFSLYIHSPRKGFRTFREFILDVVKLLGESASGNVLELLEKDLKNDVPVVEPYSKGILDDLRAYGIISAVMVNLPSFFILNIIDELTGYVDRWFSISDIGLPRGHPDFYTQVFNELRMQPENILVVGPDELLDYHFAKLAGALPLYIGNQDLEPNIQSVEQLMEYLNQLMSTNS